MTHKQIQLIQESWLSIAALDPVMVGDTFYLKLFELCPEVRPMFQRNLPEQSKKLLYMLHYIIVRLDRFDDLAGELQSLARRHVRYGVKEEHYAVVGAALLWALGQALGERWNKETESAWATCYYILSTTMIEKSYYNISTQ
jgi:nitric oxide dioxygenase